MKRKHYRIPIDRILQISNDISEDMLSPKTTKAELVEVILYFRDEFDQVAHELTALRLEIVSRMLRETVHFSKKFAPLDQSIVKKAFEEAAPPGSKPRRSRPRKKGRGARTEPATHASK